MGRAEGERASEFRVLRIVESLLELDPHERLNAARDACGGDEALFDRVQHLLERESEGELTWVAGFPRPSDLLAPESIELRPGTHIGGYEVIRVVGRGGMSQVLEAMQSSPRRRVALKLLRLGDPSEELRRRFELESEVLAHLEHPRIAKIYEAGVHVEETPAGRREWPFLALEFVPGATPLVPYVRSEGLSRRAVLELFLGVCAAIQHGHEKGVIHRDIKSGNVLVDENGRVKVIDFGVARLRDSASGGDPGTTRVGELVGTLETMSPEQFAGSPSGVDTRSDVYALGALLYELLTGAPIRNLSGLAMGEIARVIERRDPPAPRSIRPDLEPELDAVLQRALDRDPERRYPSAAALAEDLSRFLRNEPVEARRPSPLRRAQLFARRNPVIVTAAVVIVVSLLAATGISTRYALEASRAAERSQRVALAAREAREAESAALHRSRALREDLLEFTEAVSRGLIARLEDAGGSTSLRRAATEFVIDQIDALHARAARDVPTLVSLGWSSLALGDTLGNPTQSNLGDLDAAEAVYRDVEGIAQELAEVEGGEGESALLRASLEQRRGDVARGRRAFEQAMESYDRAIAAIEGLPAAVSADSRARGLLAAVLSAKASLLGGVEQDYPAANALLRRSLEVLRELEESEGSREARRANIATLGAKLAGGLLMEGRPGEAVALFENSLRERRALSAAHPESLDERRAVLEVVAPYVQALTAAGRFEEAREEGEEGLAEARELASRAADDLRLLSLEPVLLDCLAECELAWARERPAEGAEEHRAAAARYVDAASVRLQELRSGELWSGMLAFVESQVRSKGEAIRTLEGAPGAGDPTR